jgi:hypothetical protein
MNDSELDQLLQRARGTAPLPGRKAELRSRTLAAAAAGSALTLAASEAAAAGKIGVALAGSKASGGLLFGVLSWLAGGAALGLVVAAVSIGISERVREPAASSGAAANSARFTTRPSAGAAAKLAIPRRAREIENAAPGPEAPRARPVAADSGLPSIERETELLTEAQSALRRGDAPSALAALERYDAEFPRGALSEEAGAARAVTFCSLGRTALARRALDAFRRNYPNSPLLERVTSSCRDVEGRGDFETESGSVPTQPGKPSTVDGSGSFEQ